MRLRACVVRALSAAMLGGALVAAVPAAMAGAAPAATDDGTLTAPVLTSVTRQVLSDGRPGDTATLVWDASSGPVFDYAIYGDGRFIYRTGDADASFGILNLASEGLDGSETITVRAEGGVAPDGTPTSQSADSNGLTASPAVELTPTPEMTSAVLHSDAGTVTLTWTPTHTDEISGHLTYYVYATPVIDFGTWQVATVEDATTVTFDLAPNAYPPITGSEHYYVVARDRTYLDASAPSNMLVPTEG